MVRCLVDRVLARYPLDPFHSDALGCLAKIFLHTLHSAPLQDERMDEIKVRCVLVDDVLAHYPLDPFHYK